MRNRAGSQPKKIQKIRNSVGKRHFTNINFNKFKALKTKISLKSKLQIPEISLFPDNSDLKFKYRKI